MALGHAQSVLPLLLKDVHVHGLARLAGLDELLLGLGKHAAVLESEGMLVVDVGQLALGVLVGQIEGQLEIADIGRVLHRLAPSKP